MAAVEPQIAALEAAYRELAEDLQRLQERALIDSAGARLWDVRFTEQRMAQVRARIAELDAKVLGPDGQPGMIGRAVTDAYRGGLTLADAAAAAQGQSLPAANLALGGLHATAVEAIAQEAVDAAANVSKLIGTS